MGKYLSSFSPNTGKYGPEKTPYLDTYHAVNITRKIINTRRRQKSWSLKSPSTQPEPHKAITLESTYEAENLNWNSASL